MKNVNEMTFDEIKALETEIKDRKAALKEEASSTKAEALSAREDACDNAIKSGTLYKGATVVVIYKNTEVTGTVATDPSVDRPTINVTSPDFDGNFDKNGEKRRYIKKGNFVCVA